LALQGEFGQAIELCLRAVSSEPLRESAQRQLIQVYLAEGNGVDALRQFHAYEALISDELGLDPSDEMAALVRGLNPRRETLPSPGPLFCCDAMIRRLPVHSISGVTST
jgi:DNA-binding SARP family transcriptional activator